VKYFNSEMSTLVYLIRNGQFAEDYGFKLILTLIALVVCITLTVLRKKYDYLAVFFTGIIIWSLFEIIMTAVGVRYIVDGYLFKPSLNLHWILASILRGSSEGAVVAIVGIIFGDYIPRKKTWKFALPAGVLLIGYFMFRTLRNSLAIRDVGGAVSSRREVFAWPSILFFAIFVIFTVVWFILSKDSQLRKRALSMFVTILIFATLWAVSQYFANTRWIEIDTGGGYVEASPIITVLVFAWDLIIEVALCYVAFFTIPNTLYRTIKKYRGIEKPVPMIEEK
jgi:hypothetical protein